MNGSLKADMKKIENRTRLIAGKVNGDIINLIVYAAGLIRAARSCSEIYLHEEAIRVAEGEMK